MATTNISVKVVDDQPLKINATEEKIIVVKLLGEVNELMVSQGYDVMDSLTFQLPKLNVYEDELVTVKIVDADIIPINILGEFTEQPSSPYSGSYEVTPTQSEQTLLTQNKTLSENIVVHKIPSNYGKITWNGAILTVS